MTDRQTDRTDRPSDRSDRPFAMPNESFHSIDGRDVAAAAVVTTTTLVQADGSLLVTKRWTIPDGSIEATTEHGLTMPDGSVDASRRTPRSGDGVSTDAGNGRKGAQRGADSDGGDDDNELPTTIPRHPRSAPWPPTAAAAAHDGPPLATTATTTTTTMRSGGSRTVVERREVETGPTNVTTTHHPPPPAASAGGKGLDSKISGRNVALWDHGGGRDEDLDGGGTEVQPTVPSRPTITAIPVMLPPPPPEPFRRRTHPRGSVALSQIPRYSPAIASQGVGVVADQDTPFFAEDDASEAAGGDRGNRGGAKSKGHGSWFRRLLGGVAGGRKAKKVTTEDRAEDDNVTQVLPYSGPAAVSSSDSVGWDSLADGGGDGDSRGAAGGYRHENPMMTASVRLAPPPCDDDDDDVCAELVYGDFDEDIPLATIIHEISRRKPGALTRAESSRFAALVRQASSSRSHGVGGSGAARSDMNDGEADVPLAEAIRFLDSKCVRAVRRGQLDAIVRAAASESSPSRGGDRRRGRPGDDPAASKLAPERAGGDDSSGPPDPAHPSRSPSTSHLPSLHDLCAAPASGESDTAWYAVLHRVANIDPREAKEAMLRVGVVTLPLPPSSSSSLAAAAAAARGGKGDEHAGRTPLHVACTRRPPPAVVRALLSASAWPAQMKDASGFRPVHLACLHGACDEVVRLLLDAGKEGGTFPSSPSSNGKEREDVGGCRPDGGSAEDNGTKGSGGDADDDNANELCRLCRAPTDGEFDPRWDAVISYMDDIGPSPRARAEVERRCSAHLGRTPLHAACARRPPARVVTRLLMASGTPARWEDREGSLPLHVLSRCGGGIESIRAVVDANPEARSSRDVNGRRPVEVWIETRGVRPPPPSVVEELLPWDADEGSTLLKVPIPLPRLHELILAVEGGERSDDGPVWGEVLHFLSITNGHSDGKKDMLLLSYVEEQSGSSRRTALHLACCFDPPPSVVDALLRVSTAPASVPDALGFLPIHLACLHGSRGDVLRMLVQANPSSIYAMDGRGCTPIQIEFEKEKIPPPSIAQLLSAPDYAGTIADDSERTGREEGSVARGGSCEEDTVGTACAHAEDGGDIDQTLQILDEGREPRKSELSARRVGKAKRPGAEHVYPTNRGDKGSRLPVASTPIPAGKSGDNNMPPTIVAVPDFGIGSKTDDQHNFPGRMGGEAVMVGMHTVPDIPIPDIPHSTISVGEISAVSSLAHEIGMVDCAEAHPTPRLEDAIVNIDLSNSDPSRLRSLCRRAQDLPGDAGWEAVRLFMQSFDSDSERTLAVETMESQYLATPLHLVCCRSPPADVVKMLLDASAMPAQWPDSSGSLPIHVACLHRASAEVVRLLLEAFPDSKSITDDAGRVPLHYTCRNIRNEPPAPEALGLVIEKSFVTVKDKKGHVPLRSFGYQAKKIRSHQTSEVQKAKKCLDLFLNTEPEGNSEFLRALQNLPTFLRQVAVVHPHTKRVLNRMISQRFSTSILFLDFYVHLLLIVSFALAVKEHINASRQEALGLLGGKGIFGWHIACMYGGSAYLTVRELSQLFSLVAAKEFSAWFLDLWNWLDVSNICLVASSAAVMHSGGGEHISVRALLIATGGVVWIKLVGVLRTFMLDFAVFVSGVIRVIWVLVPFIVTVGLVLGAFAQMYFINATTDLTCFEREFDPASGLTFCQMGEAFLKTYAMFVAGGIEEVDFTTSTTTAWLTAVFAFLVVILLLSVLIAIVTDSYVEVRHRSEIVFWWHRFNFVFEVDSVKCFFFCRRSRIKNRGVLPPEGGNNSGRNMFEIMRLEFLDPFDAAVFEARREAQEGWSGPGWFFSKASDRSPSWIKRALLALVIPLWFLAGLLTIGWLWPPQVREFLLCPYIPDDISERKSNSTLRQQDRRSLNISPEDVADAVYSKMKDEVQNLKSDLMNALRAMDRYPATGGANERKIAIESRARGANETPKQHKNLKNVQVENVTAI